MPSPSTSPAPDTKTVTVFEPDQTKPMHFYLIRSDLSGYQHVHPSMATDGTWTADLAALTPGTAATAPIPAASPTTTVDGYTLTLSGQPMAGRADTMTLHVAQNGQPVTNLQPYLDTYAHLSAFHTGDLAFAHLHPSGVLAGSHRCGWPRSCRRFPSLAGCRPLPWTVASGQ